MAKNISFDHQVLQERKRCESFGPKKRKPDGKVDVPSEVTDARNQEKERTKKLTMRKIHANKLQRKLRYSTDILIPTAVSPFVVYSDIYIL